MSAAPQLLSYKEDPPNQKHPNDLYFNGSRVIYELPDAGIQSTQYYGMRTIQHPSSEPITTVLESSWIVSIMPFKDDKKIDLIGRFPIHKVNPGGITQYSLPPAKSVYGRTWEFVAIPIFSTVIGYVNKTDLDVSTMNVGMTIESSKAVCNVILDRWVSKHQAPNGGHPGIARVPDGVMIPGAKVPRDKWPAAFAAFIENLVVKQNLYFQWMVADANESYRKNGLARIHENSRTAARWVYGNAADQIPWMSVVDVLATKSCPACSKPIHKNVAVCTECKTNLLEYYLSPFSGLDDNWVESNDPDLYPRYLVAQRAIAQSYPEQKQKGNQQSR